MRDKLIKLLGGRTETDYTLLAQEYTSQRNLALVLRDQVDKLTMNFNSANEERIRLQEIIFKNYGVVQGEEIPSPAIDDKLNKLQPVGSAKQRWSSLRSSIEADDRARVLASGSIER